MQRVEFKLPLPRSLYPARTLVWPAGYPFVRSNPDVRLRELERAAAAGDLERAAPAPRARLDAWLEEAVPAFVLKYLIQAQALRACSAISPAFAVVARHHGFLAYQVSAPGHFLNVVLTREGPVEIDLSEIQFRACELAGGDVGRKAVRKILPLLVRDPWRAVRIRPYEGRMDALEEPRIRPDAVEQELAAYRMALADVRGLRTGDPETLEDFADLYSWIRPGEWEAGRRRKNPDPRLRELERAAATGGPAEAAQYLHALARADPVVSRSVRDMEIAGGPELRGALSRIISSAHLAPSGLVTAAYGPRLHGSIPLVTVYLGEPAPPKFSHVWGPWTGDQLVHFSTTSISWSMENWLRDSRPGGRDAPSTPLPVPLQPFLVNPGWVPTHGSGFAVPLPIAQLWAKANAREVNPCSVPAPARIVAAGPGNNVPQIRRNADVRLRELERRAAAGDPEAAQRLRVEQVRRGLRHPLEDRWRFMVRELEDLYWQEDDCAELAAEGYDDEDVDDCYTRVGRLEAALAAMREEYQRLEEDPRHVPRRRAVRRLKQFMDEADQQDPWWWEPHEEPFREDVRAIEAFMGKKVVTKKKVTKKKRRKKTRRRNPDVKGRL